MSIDYAAVIGAMYSRAASDSAGSAFRATLGSSSSFFGASKLAQWRDPESASRPARVWAVWRPGDVSGQSGLVQMRGIGASWWLYDDPERGSTRLLATLTALEALYGDTRFALSGGRLQVSFISRQFSDDALGLTGQELRIRYQRP